MHIIPVLHTLYYAVIQVRHTCVAAADSLIVTSVLLFCNFCAHLPVRCHDSCQPLPDCVRVFDEAADLTITSLHCGPEHSEEHQDGNDHTRYYTSMQSTE